MNGMSLLFLSLFVIGLLILIKLSRNKRKQIKKKLQETFPASWQQILTTRVSFYKHLSEADKKLFEKRVQLFLATKKIEGVEAEVDDTIRVMVASSAVIPTFAFPDYNYPNLQTVLIYPGSFDEQFRTKKYEGHEEFIVGMVGNRSLNGIVILSKPDLLAAFDGQPHSSNVGVHEFVHLLDKEDGIVDGIPQLLIDRPFVGPWLLEIKKEIKKIVSGDSDINPYALTNNAEFLAVASEYFFDNPEKFKKRHPELYKFLSVMFHQNH